MIDPNDPLSAYGDKVVVLYTPMTRNQLATVATRRVVTQLKALSIPYVELDGTDLDNKLVRAALWAKADASAGTYPILYVGSTGFTCKGDEVQDLIDADMIQEVCSGMLQSGDGDGDTAVVSPDAGVERRSSASGGAGGGRRQRLLQLRKEGRSGRRRRQRRSRLTPHQHASNTTLGRGQNACCAVLCDAERL